MREAWDRLVVQCPSCKRRMAPLPFYRHATAHVSRTCRRCGECWQITAVPRLLTIQSQRAVMHVITYRFLGHTGKSQEAERYRQG